MKARLLMRAIAKVVTAGALVSMVGAGCGKDPNVHEKLLVEFPNSLPSMPIATGAPTLPDFTSGRAIAVHGDVLIALDRDNGDVVTMDRNSLEVTKRAAVGDRPEQLVVNDAGDIFIAARRSGEVVRFDAQLNEVARARIATETHGIAMSLDQQRLYVTLPMESEVVTLDASNLAELDRDRTDMLPRGVAVSPNGFLAVSSQNSAASIFDFSLDGLLEEATYRNLPLRDGNPVDLMGAGHDPAGLHQVRALAVTIQPSNGRALIAHVNASPGTDDGFIQNQLGRVEGDPDEISAPVDGYGSQTGRRSSTVSFIVPTRPIESTVTATDSYGQPAVTTEDFPVRDTVTGQPISHLVDQPSDINHHPTWSLAFMTGYGSDNVLVLNTAESDPMRSPLAVIDVGQAPQAITFSEDGNTAYVLNDHDFTVSEVDLRPLFDLTPTAGQAVVVGDSDFAQSANGKVTKPVRMVSARSAVYGEDPRSPAVRRGARVFTFTGNDRISHGGQFACASCHYEGTEDKLVWFITDGPRQTPALAGRLGDTAPFNWNGSKDLLQENMSQTVERMGGEGLTGQELADLEEFMLVGLEPPLNPNLGPNGLTPQQELGKALFNDPIVACVSCHSGAAYTDGGIHNVGTGSDAERIVFEEREFMGVDPGEVPGRLNTPTLRGLHYTAPYLHDGSAPTLKDVLRRTATTMGKTDHLTDEELDALVAYLKTL